MSKPPTKNEQISQLRAQLEEERNALATLRKTVDTQKATIDIEGRGRKSDPGDNHLPFLKKLPVEIRLKIYNLLLVNPKLSETDSIGKTGNYGKDVKFELTPAILRTCKAIQNEAEPILYGSNTFIIECIGGHGPMHNLHMPQSPLTRYIGCSPDDFYDSDEEDESVFNMMGCSRLETHFDFSTFKALKKVKSWRIITAAYRPSPSCPVPAKSFVHFCQALCEQAPTQPQRSLEIILALAKAPAASPIHPLKSEDSQYAFSEKQLHLLLQPLRLLRDVKLDLNIAQFKTDLPIPEKLCGGFDYYFPYSEAQTVEVNLEKFMNLAPPIIQKYYSLVEDLSPIEKVYKMYERLEEYAATFERSGKFSIDMFTLHVGYESISREARHYGWQLPKPSLGNPFKDLSYSPGHPVELAISKAIVAKDMEDVDGFKRARASVLKELEPQYRRMIDASKKLRLFVEKETHSGVFHKCNGCGVFHQYEDSYESTLADDLDRYLYELEKIASLLERPMPDRIRIAIKKGATMYDSAYFNMERETFFRKLRWMQKQELHLKDPSLIASQIAKWVQGVVEDMWVECGSASWCRQSLFIDDTTDIRCKINQKLGAGLIDEDLEWGNDESDSADEEFLYMHGHLMGD